MDYDATSSTVYNTVDDTRPFTTTVPTVIELSFFGLGAAECCYPFSSSSFGAPPCPFPGTPAAKQILETIFAGDQITLLSNLL